MKAMRSFFASKFWIILLSVIALGALLELAIGMESMSFREAQPFGRNEASAPRTSPFQLVDSVMSVPLKTQLIVWILFVLLFTLIGMLLSPEMRKRLIRTAIRVAITYWAFFILFKRYREVLAQIGANLTPSGAESAATANGLPPPEFTPPTASSWPAYLLSFGIAIGLILLAWRAYAVWKELNTPAAAGSMHKFAKIARASLRDLSTGRDSTDVIMNCYYRMSDVVADKKNLDRNLSMTPSEFAVRLEQAGLPGDAVKRLTRLFESTRYGGHRSDSASVNEAVTCLTAILHYCGETV